jgi:excisionase family DNA binding protein
MERLAERAQAQLHDVEAVMKRLGLGRSKTFELIATGRLRSVKIGRRRLVSEAALTEYIENLDAGGAT